MNLRPSLFLLFVGCGAVPQSGDVLAFTHESGSYSWRRHCVPYGDVKRVRGVLRTSPFGKGVDGTYLESAGTKWAVDYRSSAQHRALSGRLVEATGRDCSPQGQSLVIPHFDIQTLTVLE